MPNNSQNAASRQTFRQQPLVSIVIDNYNYAGFLPDAINSALNQTYKNVEVIVVDDGSIDDSRQVIESYGNRIKGIYKTNGGQASALNAGFAAARGELIYFLDSDDVVLPESLEKIAGHYMPEVADKKAVTVQFRMEVIDNDGKPTGGITPNLEKLQGAIAGQLLANKGSYVHPPTSGNVFSRKFLQKAMPIPEQEYRISADLYLCTLAALAGDVIDIEENLAQYRIHGANHCGTTMSINDRLPAEIYIELMLDESSARSRQKKICANYLRQPIGGNTDLLYLIFKATKEKLLKTSAGSFGLARKFWSDLRQDASLVPTRNKLAAGFYLMSVALLPRRIVRRLVNLIFVRPPKPFAAILKKSFGC